ncbi:MAG: FAD-dependent oxidoreductase [Cyclobacteriaceae bacterium]
MPTSNTISGWGNFPKAKSNLYNFRIENDLLLSYSDDYLIPRGLGRSYGDQAINLNQGVLLTQNLNRLLDFDEETGILTCEAGVSLAEIIHIFSPRGWFPMIAPGTKYVTVGGAIANDIHGKGHHIDGSFVSCVTEFTVLLADGSVVTASRSENPDLFWSSFGGLGLLGIILSASIRLRKIETTFFSHQSVRVNSLDHLLDSIDEFEKENNYSVAWVDSLARGSKLGKGVLTLGNHASKTDLATDFSHNPLKVSEPPKFAVPFELPAATLNKVSV